MTRREEVEKQSSLTVFPWDDVREQVKFEDGFIEGAKWADRTMIEKATQWITEHIDIPYEGEFIDDSPVASDYIEWCEKRLEYAKAVADAFKQAMEE